jgi:hypothetical protein
MERDQRPQRRNKALKWLLWWMIDEDELDEQVAEYRDLPIYVAARGLSLLLLLFSAAMTAAVIFFGLLEPIGYVDAALMTVLGLFIYFGHRWAMILTMVVWTIEKGMLIVEPLQGGGTPMNLVVQMFWWAIYMHAFYLAFRVEQERRKRRLSPEIEKVFD